MQSSVALVPGAASNLIISLGGVLQEPEVAYTVAGSSIIFSSAPASTQPFFGILLGDVLDVGQVSQGAVINATSLTVTGAATLSNTLAVTGAVTGGTYNSQTINATASLTGTLAVTGAVTGGTYNSQTINATASLTGTLKVATTVGVGAATPSSNGAGITFPATQSASTDANTLDDYEEGTWTPSLTGSTSGSATSGGNTFGFYTKVGRLVTLNFVITISAVSTLTGNVKLSGIPFSLPSANQENRYPQGATGFGSLNTSWASIVVGSDGGTTTLAFIGTKTPATATTSLAAADLTATTTLYGSIQYIA